MRADGKTPRRITNTPGFDDWAAKWSPDGHIYTFNADGSELRPVTRGVVSRVATMTNKR